jgi:hypothetical protein
LGFPIWLLANLRHARLHIKTHCFVQRLHGIEFPIHQMCDAVYLAKSPLPNRSLDSEVSQVASLTVDAHGHAQNQLKTSVVALKK